MLDDFLILPTRPESRAPADVARWALGLAVVRVTRGRYIANARVLGFDCFIALRVR